MKRRQFIQSLIPAGLLAGGILNLNAFQGSPADNVIIKKGLPRFRFRKGIEEVGGIQRFIKKGDRVVLKPTMAFDKTPDSGFNSNPELIEEIIVQCLDADAKIVTVFDHTFDFWTKCYKNSGIERITKDAMARVLPANDERYYTEVSSSKLEKTENLKIHNSILKADVFINVAASVINNEGQFRGALKNLSGCAWDRDFFEIAENENALIELANYIQPSLNVVDGNGFQVLSTDFFAADILTLQTLGRSPEDCKYLHRLINSIYSEGKQVNLNYTKEISL